MSFGFSAGDFIAGAKLIKDIITALNGAPELEYRGLELELYGLERALDELGQSGARGWAGSRCGLCEGSSADVQTSTRGVSREAEPGLRRKVQWTLSMPDEIQRLRAYIAAHVGSLNMRLLTLGLTSMAISERESRRREIELFNMLEQQALSTSQNSTQSGLIYKLVVQTIIPQLQNIAGLVGKVLLSNLQILAHVTNMNSSRVDSKHTWFQQPLRFEDAFGRVVPIPVEYGWSICGNSGDPMSEAGQPVSYMVRESAKVAPKTISTAPSRSIEWTSRFQDRELKGDPK
ncbi:hypothetical protein IFR05_015753 [Cadophora sp. M221]|nr:hypothetical protein IFR05_015753 [Cadophora sp. M221]